MMVKNNNLQCRRLPPVHPDMWTPSAQPYATLTAIEIKSTAMWLDTIMEMF
jgi:hypothetical protein